MNIYRKAIRYILISKSDEGENNMESLANLIFTVFKTKDKFSLKELYEAFSNKPNTTLRARVYDNLGVKFEKVAKGIYCTKDDKNICLLMEDDGRDLSMFEDQSIDCIITDHPWNDKKSYNGGSRKFALYNCFNYTQEDFKEKASVLKEGAFLVEIIPLKMKPIINTYTN